jgi:hypothetical protein
MNRRGFLQTTGIAKLGLTQWTCSVPAEETFAANSTLEPTGWIDSCAVGARFSRIHHIIGARKLYASCDAKGMS